MASLDPCALDVISGRSTKSVGAVGVADDLKKLSFLSVEKFKKLS